jgi:hypothetical protein
MNQNEETEFADFVKTEIGYLDKSISRPPNKEVLDRVDERDRKICMGEWDGPDTPYVKFIREFYKDRNWSKSFKIENQNTSDNTNKKLTIEMFGSKNSWEKIGTLENCSLKDAEKFVGQIKEQYPFFTSNVIFRVV